MRIHADPDPEHWLKSGLFYDTDFFYFFNYRDDQSPSATNHQLQRGGSFTWCRRQNGAEDHGDSRLWEIELGNFVQFVKLKDCPFLS